MNIKVTGTHRHVNVTLEQLEKHKESIEHWVDGGEVEILKTNNAWELIEPPSFLVEITYRPVLTPSPKQGEVWQVFDMTFIVTENDQFLNISDASLWNHHTVDVDSLVFSADSIESYYQ